MNSIQNSALRFYKRNKVELLTSFLSTFIFGLIAHAYGFLNNIFSHDSLNALYADLTEEKWKLSLGRFIVPIFRAFRGPVALPFVIGIASIVFVFAATFLIIKMFDIKSNPIMVLVSGIMITNITFTACTATYIYELDFDMFAMFLAVCSVYIWNKGTKIIHYLLSVTLIFISLGIYQSNITVVSTLMIMVIIFDIFNGINFKRAFIKGIKGVAVISVGSVMYYITTKILPLIIKYEVESRTDALNVSDSLSQNITVFNSINAMIFYEIERIIHPFTVLPELFASAVNIVLILVGIILAIVAVFKLGKNKIKEKILLLALFAMLPVSIGFIEILTKGSMHELMIFSFWFIPVLVLLLCTKTDSLYCGSAKHTAKIIAVICISITIWNNILVANTAYLKKDLEQQSTIAAMTRVVSDLEEFEGYSVGKSKICFIGADFLGNNMPGFDSVSKIEGLNFSNSIGVPGKSWYYSSYDKFFTYFLNYPVNIVDNSFIDEKAHNEIMKMPSFPSDGYIKEFNDTIVIKIS